MYKKSYYQSAGNVSRDSGVQILNRPGTHSRNPSSTSTAYSTCESASSDDQQRGPLLFARLLFSRWLWISIAMIVLLITISCYFFWVPMLIKSILQSIIAIKPGTEFYEFWHQSSEPTEVGIYFFHVENPWAVENGLEKLRVKEMGKYMFKQKYFRDIHNFNEDHTLVNFTEKRYFYFDADKTVGSLDDNITVVNVPYAALSSLVPKFMDSLPGVPILSNLGLFNHVSYYSLNTFLDSHEQHLFINTTIRELLYGYKLDILDTADSIVSRFGISMPTKLFPNNSFGILNGRNGTPDGPYEMYTGSSPTQDQFSIIKSWNGFDKMSMWNGDTCNAINGSDGTMWPANVKKGDRLYFFIPDICRSLYVTFQEESTYKGIPTFIFSAPDELLAGKRTNPDNECFCMEEDEDKQEERCTLDGIFDLSPCQNGVPLIVSLPHFLGADKRITDDIEGLEPDARRHRPELHVEPNMGTVIFGDSRLQMSIRVQPNQNLRGFDKLHKDLYIPIFWGYKKLGMSDEVASDLKSRLFLPKAAINIVCLAIIAISLFFLFYTLIVQVVQYKKITQNDFLYVGCPSTKKADEKHMICVATEITLCDDGVVDDEPNLLERDPDEESDTSDLGLDNRSLVVAAISGSPKSATFELEKLLESPETHC